jgi:hypothetical protein
VAEGEAIYFHSENVMLLPANACMFSDDRGDRHDHHGVHHDPACRCHVFGYHRDRTYLCDIHSDKLFDVMARAGTLVCTHNNNGGLLDGRLEHILFSNGDL